VECRTVIVLAIDTATRRVGCALGTADGLLGEIALGHAGKATPPRHTEQLTPAIDTLCKQTGVSLRDVGAIAVSIGPGMFTGLRVGVVTAKALAHALAVPVVAVPTLDLVAWPLRHARHTCVVPLIDARRNEVYCAWYRPVPGGVQRDGEYQLLTPDDVAAELTARREPALVCGDGALRFATAFEGDDLVELAGPDHAAPSLAALVDLACARAARGDVCAPADVVPMYLRRSDAELALEARS
jgi:tRNA threonylcarbamoyladenosine biosynthesis protein TsaB